jgi:hypothetical protein
MATHGRLEPPRGDIRLHMYAHEHETSHGGRQEGSTAYSQPAPRFHLMLWACRGVSWELYRPALNTDAGPPLFRLAGDAEKAPEIHHNAHEQSIT